MPTPSKCCGARCKHCDVWPTLDRDQPPSAYCRACEATVYVDGRRRCIPCGAEVTRDT